MSRYFKVPIKVKPHVKKYLQSIVGDKILISGHNPISLVIYAFLQKKRQYLSAGNVFSEHQFQKQTETVYLLIQKRGHYRNSIFLHQSNHITINHFFEKEITAQIHTLANSFEACKKTRLAAVEFFCKQHNIDIPEDVTEYALLQNDIRFSKTLMDIKKQQAEIEKEF